MRATFDLIDLVRRYLRRVAFVRPLLHLLWSAGPRWLLGTALLALVNGLLPTATLFIGSALLNVLVEAVVEPHPTSALPTSFITLLVLLGGTNVISRIVSQVSTSFNALYQKLMTNHVSLLIADKASSLDFPSFEDPQFFDQLSIAATEASFRPMLIINQVTQLVSSLVTLVSVVVILVLWHLWIVPIVVVFSFTRYLVSARFGSERVNLVLGRTPMNRMAQYVGMLLTGDYAAKEVRLFNLQGFLLGRYRTLLDTMYQQDRKLAKQQVLASAAVEVLASVGSPVLVAYVALQVVQRLISIGQFNLYSQSIVQVDLGFAGIMSSLAQLYENSLYIDNLFSFLAMQPHIEAPRLSSEARRALISATPAIELRDVSFQYPGTLEPVIDHLNLRIEPGEVIALVGENGAGKTTLVKLLAGLYVPTSGQILFDGVDVADLDREVLRNYLGVIFQDFSTYHFSAAENIGVGRVEHIGNREHIESAAHLSGFDHVVGTLPEGYDTVLGRFIDRGHELSGGQRQLVGLARALMRNAPILVLDEPASALDTRNELKFFRQLLDSREAKRQTIFFISHRFSTVRRADRIVVLEHGSVLELGSHDELMALGGRYAEMFTTQVRMYGKDALEELDGALASESVISGAV